MLYEVITILRAEQEEQNQQTVYGADGKLNGEALTLMPVKITDEYIIYEDRVRITSYNVCYTKLLRVFV